MLYIVHNCMAVLKDQPSISSDPGFNNDWFGSLLAYARFISCIEQAGLTSAQLHELPLPSGRHQR